MATFEKHLEYIRFDEETQSFIPSNDEEHKSIMKSFLKRENDKGPGGKLINCGAFPNSWLTVTVMVFSSEEFP